MSRLFAHIERLFQERWYPADNLGWSKFARLLLTPLNAIYTAIARKKLVERSVANSQRGPVVVVIGNITVGGTGKTPLIIALAAELIAKDLRVGVVSRGYGGQFAQTQSSSARFVQIDDSAALVGDEPALIVEKMNSLARYGKTFGLAIGVNRTLAIDTLKETLPVDVILSDDGLQHYRMPRHIELVVIDGSRGFGNGELLPLGPLREPLERLALADLALINGDAQAMTRCQLDEQGLKCLMFSGHNRFVRAINTAAYRMERKDKKARIEPAMQPAAADNSDSQAQRWLPIGQLLEKLECLHLLAGIGNPQRYFAGIQRLLCDYNADCVCVEHAFPDHHRFSASELHSVIGQLDKPWDLTAILVTEKDAVKLRDFADKLPVAVFAARLDIDIDPQVVDLIASRVERRETSD